MSDTSYPVEIKLVSQYMDNGEKRWFTPAESNAYYATRYARNGITVHHWGDNGANTHDQTVAFFQRRQDGGSVNYVCSDEKITLMVSPDNVAFTSQSGNPTTISIEHQTFLGPEGYKKSGWLVDQLEQRYGKTLPLYKHSYWFATACPGSIDLNRIRQEANNWKNGVYDQAAPPPVVVVEPPTVTYTVTDIPNKKVRLIRDANLWNLHFTSYANAQSVQTLKAGTEIEVSATAKHQIGSTYYLSEYSFQKGIGNGINVKDCEDVAPAPATPEPIQVTPPVVIEVPVKVPEVITKDQEQDAKINALTLLVDKIADFLASIFSGFKK